MGRRVTEQALDDVCASTIEADVSTQVVVNPFIRDRTQEDDEREHRQEQYGSEEDDRTAEVDRLESRDNVLQPRTLEATLCDAINLARSISGGMAVASMPRRSIIGGGAESRQHIMRVLAKTQMCGVWARDRPGADTPPLEEWARPAAAN
jgi:hypothetical protein